eukprot:CAMPEP_0206247674 /NCGR_PEP_ID=MMETSP0047_2-20121206/19944_1 /ASSEMBLY_ACC=CAM_ASM_000192 /TAXON_ID=195065 /ORGANISM="Chroomonas mesostigmatica_cf, Strain CCMP1168" /LENGTH=99 /DNA_ID=CAMNT_0053673231 /DNA_START=547 /DNA_END=846 /DNA_ORIENTATION=+
MAFSLPLVEKRSTPETVLTRSMGERVRATHQAVRLLAGWRRSAGFLRSTGLGERTLSTDPSAPTSYMCASPDQQFLIPPTRSPKPLGRQPWVSSWSSAE